MTEKRVEAIRKRLQNAFEPQELKVTDESQLHVGHEGAKEGKGHFEVTIVSAAFAATSRLQRHRMVYQALSDLIESDIHALRIHAFDPAEARLTD